MRVYTSNDFTGHYPVGTAMVIVAINEDQAIKLANEICIKHGLVFNGTLVEIETNIEIGYMLHDGDY